jgi:hypothetical protein
MVYDDSWHMENPLLPTQDEWDSAFEKARREQQARRRRARQEDSIEDDGGDR